MTVIRSEPMLAVVPINDADDPRVAPYRDIRERDVVGRQGLFIAEGEVVLRVLLGATSRFRPASVLIADKRVAALRPLLDRASPTPVYAASQAVIDRIAGFPMHRGILALGHAGPPPAAEALVAAMPSRAVIVVACGIANHDNLGGIFRNAAAFGATGVLLDADCCDPLYRKAIRVSAGASLTQPYARLRRDEDGLALLTRHGFDLIALSPRGERDLREVRRVDRIAALFGTEGPGLAPEILARATTVRIPMTSGVDSLNVAVATGIVLYHLSG
jgi:tRNA G18 (ribose-2'-O)-methylase SpoU